jgi:hypothetical protein
MSAFTILAKKGRSRLPKRAKLDFDIIPKLRSTIARRAPGATSSCHAAAALLLPRGLHEPSHAAVELYHAENRRSVQQQQRRGAVH